MARWMSTARVMLAAILLAAAFPMPAHGQAGPVPLYLAYNDASACPGEPDATCQIARLLGATIDGPRSRVNWTRDIPAVERIQYGYVSPDGRLVAWLGTSQTVAPIVYLHDTVAGTTSAFGPFHGAGYMFGNPARPEVYLASNGAVTVLGPAGTRQISLPSVPFGLAVQLPGVSANGALASIVTSHGSSGSTVVFDTATGATVAVQPGIGVISAAGDTLFLLEFENGAYRLRHRTLSGAILGDVPHRGNGALKADSATGGVVSYLRSAAPNVFALDATSLATTGSVTLNLSGFGNYPEPVLHEGSGLVAAFADGVDVGDLRTGQLVARAPLRAAPLGALVFGAAVPPPPGALTSGVSGGAVTLGWAASARPAAVTRYVLEVGSAPGLTDIFSGLDVGLQTSFGASNVPPGTYYVRVRAGNYSGLGAPSNEVEVQVR